MSWVFWRAFSMGQENLIYRFVAILYTFAKSIVHFIMSNRQLCASLVCYYFKMCVYQYVFSVIAINY